MYAKQGTSSSNKQTNKQTTLGLGSSRFYCRPQGGFTRLLVPSLFPTVTPLLLIATHAITQSHRHRRQRKHTLLVHRFILASSLLPLLLLLLPMVALLLLLLLVRLLPHQQIMHLTLQHQHLALQHHQQVRIHQHLPTTHTLHLLLHLLLPIPLACASLQSPPSPLRLQLLLQHLHL